MKPSHILVIGSLNMDLVVTAPRTPDEGETIMGSRFQRFFGGKGANQAVSGARLGGSVTMLGRLGADVFGNEQLQSLKDEGIDVRYITQDHHQPSGVASIILEEYGKNRIIVVPGANGAISRQDIDVAERAMKRADVVVLQLEIPLDTVAHAVKKAAQMGKRVILNPAPAQMLDSSLFHCISVITPNESEAKLLTGIDVHDKASARKAAKELLNRGVGQVIITLGSGGVYGCSQRGEFHIHAHRVKPVDTVAAGDAFSGGLAVALGEGRALLAAAKLANAAAAIAVTRPGAQPSMPTRGEVEAYLRNEENA